MMYHMKLRFKLSFSNKALNAVTEPLDGGKFVANDLVEVGLEQTVPFIPNAETIKEYEEILKEAYSKGSFQVERVNFAGYAFLEEVKEEDPNNV